MLRVCLFVVLCLSAGLAWGEPIGQVKVVRGTAVVVRNGAIKPLVVGALVQETDTLRTQADGYVVLVLIDNARFTLGPNSEMALELFRFEAKTKTGSMRAKVKQGTVAATAGEIAHSTAGAMVLTTPTQRVVVQSTRVGVYVRSAKE